MGEIERSDILRRKARTAREEHQARVMSPSRAMRLGIARAADEAFELSLTATSVQLGMAAQAEAISRFHDDRLLILLDGPAGAVGAAAIDLPILAGLIEQQTMGVVLSRSPDLRPPTETDAALVAPLLDASLAEFAQNLTGEEEEAWARGFRFGAMVEEARMLGLLLEAADFHVFHIELDMCGGAKQGEMVLALPVPEPEPLQCDEPACEGGVPALTTPGCPKRLGQGALLVAEAPMQAVLHRMRLPLAKVTELRVGDTLSFPREAIAKTRLEVGQGEVMCSGRLGQVGGFRAVKIAPAKHAQAASGQGAGGAEEGRGTGAAEDVGLTGAAPPRPDLKPLEAPPGAGERPAGAVPEGDREVPGLPPMDDLPDLGAVGELPDLPEIGEMGDLTDLPELALDGAGPLPDLPDLPDLADLPEIK